MSLLSLFESFYLNYPFNIKFYIIQALFHIDICGFQIFWQVMRIYVYMQKLYFPLPGWIFLKLHWILNEAYPQLWTIQKLILGFKIKTFTHLQVNYSKYFRITYPNWIFLLKYDGKNVWLDDTSVSIFINYRNKFKNYIIYTSKTGRKRLHLYDLIQITIQ